MPKEELVKDWVRRKAIVVLVVILALIIGLLIASLVLAGRL